jgi:diacylglycerol kinase (ATP)
MQGDAMTASSFKGRKGLSRLLHATRYSLAGLRATWSGEAAFRQEVVVGLLMIVAAPWLARTGLEAILMIGSVLLVWVVELLNSAIEAVCDAVSESVHPLLGRAKDMGSAAVLVSLVIVILTWGGVLGLRVWTGATA